MKTLVMMFVALGIAFSAPHFASAGDPVAPPPQQDWKTCTGCYCQGHIWGALGCIGGGTRGCIHYWYCNGTYGRTLCSENIQEECDPDENAPNP